MEIENDPAHGAYSDIESQIQETTAPIVHMGKANCIVGGSRSAVSIGAERESAMDLQKRIAYLEGAFSNIMNAQRDFRMGANALASQVSDSSRSMNQSQEQQEQVAITHQQLSEIVDRSKKMIQRRMGTHREVKTQKSVDSQHFAEMGKWRGGAAGAFTDGRNWGGIR